MLRAFGARGSALPLPLGEGWGWWRIRTRRFAPTAPDGEVKQNSTDT